MKGNAALAIGALLLLAAGVAAYAAWHSLGRVTVSIHRIYTCRLSVRVSQGVIMDTDVKCVPQASGRHGIEWAAFKPLSALFWHVPKVMLRLAVLSMCSDSPAYTYYSEFEVLVIVYGVPSGTHHAFLQVLQTNQNGVFRETSESTVTINAG